MVSYKPQKISLISQNIQVGIMYADAEHTKFIRDYFEYSLVCCCLKLHH